MDSLLNLQFGDIVQVNHPCIYEGKARVCGKFSSAKDCIGEGVIIELLDNHIFKYSHINIFEVYLTKLTNVTEKEVS
jgi:hypothetical protein